MTTITHAHEPPAASSSDADAPAEARPAPHELAVAGWAFLVLVAFSPEVHAIFWAPKAALLLLVLVPGALVLAARAWSGLLAARLALVFLAVAGASTLLADRPLLALLGIHNWGTGWLFLAAVAGCWGLGTSLSRPGRRVLVTALLSGAATSAGIAWLQAGLTLPFDAIDPGGGRSAGLLGNPVHLGTIAACALVLVAARHREEPAHRHLVLAAVLVGAVQLSGARSALLVAGIVTVLAVWHLGARRGGALALAALVGLGASVGMVRAVGSEGSSATDRASVSLDPGHGSGRTAVWEAVPTAVAQRPLLGWGPARTRAATSPHVGPELAGYEGPGAYADAHNIVLEHATTTGLVGLLAFAAWLATAARRARGPLLWFAVAGGAVALAQPLSVAVTPLLALALGAAAPLGPVRWGPLARATAVVGTAAAVAASAVFLAGEVFLARAAVDFSERDAARAETLLPDWAATADVRSWIAAYHAVSGRDAAAWDEAARWARVAAERDPSSPGAWSFLADVELRRGAEQAAADAYTEALRRYPWSLRALNGSVYLAWRTGDADAVDELCERRSVVDPDPCLGEVLRIYEGRSPPPA